MYVAVVVVVGVWTQEKQKIYRTDFGQNFKKTLRPKWMAQNVVLQIFLISSYFSQGSY